MANPTPIKSLPVELITEIFVSLDSIADVTHLAETSKFFSNIWKLHAVTICGIILPRKIPSYEKVSELAVAVIRQKMGRGGPAISKAKMIVWLSGGRAPDAEVRISSRPSTMQPCMLLRSTAIIRFQRLHAERREAVCRRTEQLLGLLLRALDADNNATSVSKGYS
jgi:hypothetical protein